MKKFFFVLLPICLLLACAGEPSGTTQPGPAGMKVIYKSCTVYAGATDFIFTNDIGEDMLVQVPNDPAARTTKIPDNLTDPNAQEGPPGPNPALIGKPFLLMKNEKGVIAEIRPAE